MAEPRVLIVGGGHASAQLCASLRQGGWTGEILLVGDEEGWPYQRPPLSKTYLAGATSLDELLIRKPEFYEKAGVGFRRARVTAVDRTAHEVTLDGGGSLGYDKLVLCLGARPRPLVVPGAHLAGLHYLRDASDVEAIRSSLPATRSAVIVGAGFIGLETAAALRKLGIDVTVLETAPRVLNRVTAPQVSAFYSRLHQEEGVDIRLDVTVTALEGDGRVEAVNLDDGSRIAAQLVIAGIGVVPNVELAQNAGLEVDDGIAIDTTGRTADPDVFAAGDCASYPDSRYGRRLRLESVPSAVEHAKSVAAAICGKHAPITALPWFWSDQYDVKLQIAGLNHGHDQVVVRGNPDHGRDFACFYLADGRLVAADCLNRPQEFVFSKRAIAEGLAPDPVDLADPAVPLASLLTAVTAR